MPLTSADFPAFLIEYEFEIGLNFVTNVSARGGLKAAENCANKSGTEGSSQHHDPTLAKT
jgi:hypothetical protein